MIVLQVLLIIIFLAVVAPAYAYAIIKFKGVDELRQTSGIIALSYDPITQLVTSIHPTASSQREIIPKIRANKPININRIIKNFNSPKVTNIFAEKLQRLNVTKSALFSFEKSIFEQDKNPFLPKQRKLKKVNYLFTIEFKQVAEVSDYILTIKWQKKEFTLRELILPSAVDAAKNLFLGNGPKIIVTTHFDGSKYEEIHKTLVLLKMKIGGDLRIFVNDNIANFVVSYPTQKKMLKGYQVIKNIISSKKIEHGFTPYNGIVLTKHNHLNKSENLISYLIVYVYKSIQDKKPYFPNKIKLDQFKEMADFISYHQTFFENVKNGKINITEVDVKKYNSRQAKQYKFIFPEKQDKNVYQNLLLSSKSNQVMLLNGAGLKASKSASNYLKRIFVDVDCKWFIENHQSLSSSKVVYVINHINDIRLTRIRNDFEKISKLEFVFGMRFSESNVRNTTILKIIKPSFIIISEELAGKPFDPIASIQILSIEKLVTNPKTAFIYENPAKGIPFQQNTLKIDYFYNF